MSSGTNSERILANNSIISDNNSDLASLKNVINNLPTSGDTTAKAEDILLGKTAVSKGIKITGTLGTETKTVTPTTTSQTINPTSGKLISQVTVSAVDNTIDNNIVAENIKKDVEILGITGTLESGGGSALVEKDVNFYDYDGTLVASYTAEDFADLSALPQNPSHIGLTAQGWNWTLSDAKTYVASYGKLNMGQMYVTDDNKTRIYIHLEDGRLSPYLGFAVDGNVTVNWGDGNSEQVSGNDTETVIYTQHTYASSGDYVITLDSSDTIYFIGDGTNNRGSLIISRNSLTTGENRTYQNTIRKIELNDKTNIAAYAVAYCFNLVNITIPTSSSIDGTNVFENCYKLNSIIIPNGITSIGNYMFNNCYKLSNALIPKGITSIGNYAFNNCYDLSKVVIPTGVTNIKPNAFTTCCALNSIIIPNGITDIQNSAFSNCYNLESVYIALSVNSISASVFSSCRNLKNLNFVCRISTLSSSVFNGCSALNDIIIPANVTTIDTSALSACTSLRTIEIPAKVTQIKSSAFSGCNSLASVIIKATNLTKIEQSVFNSCFGVKYYDFTACTKVPTLANTNVFTGISTDCKIIVPDSLYESWIATNNWSTYESFIVKESDYNNT